MKMSSNAQMSAARTGGRHTGANKRRAGMIAIVSALLGGCLSSLGLPDADRAALPAILSAGGAAATPRLPDFSYAGYGFGVTPLPHDLGTVIYAVDHGVAADDGKDDSKALLRALDAARKVEGRVTVMLPRGRVQISEVIPLDRSNLVLKGEGRGPEGTDLFIPRPLKVVDTSTRQDRLREYLKRENKIQRDPDQNIEHLFSEYSWSGGFLLVGPPEGEPVSYDTEGEPRSNVLATAVSGRQFEPTLTVQSAAGLRVGQVVRVHWYANKGEHSGIVQSLYGDFSEWNARQTDPEMRLKVGSHHWSFPGRPTVAQATRIVAIDGNLLTLGDPLLHDVSDSQPAVLADWEHLTEVGIEDFRITFPMSPWFGHHLEQGYNGIYLTGVFDGWVRNLTIENADSGILTDNSASITIDSVTTTGAHTAHYSVHIGSVHNALVSNLRVENPVVHPLSINTRATRSVYLRATVTQGGLLDQHSGSNHQNLFDNLTVTLPAMRDESGGWFARLWVGGGAGYWKPGHGLFNTHWNIRVRFSNADLPRDATVVLRSGLEGPGARIVGLHADRKVEIDYRPDAHIEGTNSPVWAAPSLYEHQLAKRQTRSQN